METHVKEAELDKQQALVSVIVPIYNMEEHLDRCLKSILGQTYRNLEILLIDDGSTDGSLEIMNRYARRDPRVRVFHKENGGVSSARNLGLEMMSGEYCTFVDPDDYVAEVYVEWLLKAQAVADLAFCNAVSVPSSHKSWFGRNEKAACPTVEIVPLDDYELWGEKARAVCWGVLYPKRLISDGKFDTSLYVGEDSLFFIQCVLRCKTIAFIHENLYLYVQHDDSVVNRGYSPERWTEIIAWQKILSLEAFMPTRLRNSAVVMYVLNCMKIMGQLLDSPYYSDGKTRYLKKEIRKYREAVAYIPKEKRSVRARVVATMLFPQTTSRLLRAWYRYKDGKLRKINSQKIKDA